MMQVICLCILCAFSFNLCLGFDEAWKAFQNNMSSENREELVITNVTADEGFKIDTDVSRWISLPLGNYCYSIGMNDTGVVVLYTTLNKYKRFDIEASQTVFNKKPIDAVLMEQRKGEFTETILVLAFQDDLQLHWYSVTETKLKLIWVWNLIQPVVHINAFSVDDKSVLLLASDRDDSSARVELYQYDLTREKRWFWHSIDVSDPVKSSAFSRYEFDSFLSFPQKSLDIVTVFKHENNQFSPYGVILSKNAEKVVAFEVGFKSFLAVDGNNAGIYQFKMFGLKRQKIVNSNVNGFEYWLPIPVQIYRDDVVLLVQRKVNYTSHSSYMVEIITYDGVKFEEHEDVSCTHFGEKVEWLTCLSEHNGLVGSSYITVSDQIGLIVPKKFKSTGLFVMHFHMKEMPNPIEKQLKNLLNHMNYLQKLIDQQIKEYEQLRNFTETAEITDGKSQFLLASQNIQNEGENISPSLQIDSLAKDLEETEEMASKIVEEENKTEFDVLTLNGMVVVEGEGKFREVVVDELNGEPAKELLQDIVSKNSMGKITGNKTINQLNVRHLVFERVNGIKATELIYKDEPFVTLSGKITVHGSAAIGNLNVSTGLINELDLVNEIVNMRSEYDGKLNFEDVKVNNQFHTTIINGQQVDFNENQSSSSNHSLKLNQELDTVHLQNLTITNINGEDFDIFIKQLCLTNVKCYIPGNVKLNGDIITEKASAAYLNNIKFPEHFLFNEPHKTPAIITGRKTFQNSLLAKEIVATGKIDGVDTKKLIPLSSNQSKILGNFTFRDIEVTEQLNVIGKVLGDQIDKFLPNPTLRNTKNITSNVYFKNLEVDGEIIIENNFNGYHFGTMLNNLVYKDEDEVNITTEKDFTKGFSVLNNLDILSNSVNDVNLDSIVTKDTDQVLNITLLKGNVKIDNAHIEGKFDGRNVSQIDQELVKLCEDQHISSTLIFAEELEIENLEVTQTVNNVDIGDFLYTDGDEESDGGITFQNITAESVTVEGNLTGNIAGFNVSDFSKRYLSYSMDQIISEHFHIVHSTVDDLKAERINGENYKDFFDYQRVSERILEVINTGQLGIRDLYVNGTLNIDYINGYNRSTWTPSDILMDSKGKYKNNLIIQGNIFFNTLEVNKVGGVDWGWFTQQLIFKDEVNAKIDAPYKNFLGGITVDKLIETKRLNGILIDNILTKQGEQTISGPIVIDGNVIFKKSVNVSDNINDIDVGKLLENLKIEEEVYHVEDDMLFSRQQYISSLKVDGHVNNRNIDEHLANLVHLDQDLTFLEEMQFERPVQISGNLVINQGINGINLSSFDNIVLTTKDAEIRGPVTFKHPVLINEYVEIDGRLLATTLYGIDLDEWKENAVYLDRGIATGTYKFDDVVVHDDLAIEYLNDMEVDSFILLKTNQSLDYMEFEDIIVTKNIPVHGSVNGFKNLSREFEITVLNDRDQNISSNIIFDNVILIREHLLTSFINGKEASKIVTTNTDQNLTAVYNFKTQCKIKSNLTVQGLVDGINITTWNNNSMKILSSKTQYVYDDWNIADEIIFSNNVTGEGLINDLNLKEVVKDVEEKKNLKLRMEHSIVEDYKNMCTDVSYLYQALKKQIYKFKYFELLNTISFDYQVEYVHYFHFNNSHYLLVNEINNCSSEILVFNGLVFEHLNIVETGHISQVVTVFGERISLVIRGLESKVECTVKGTNVWIFDGHTLKLNYKIEDLVLLQESSVPYTFYGLGKQDVTEYKIEFNVPMKYRKWDVMEENVAFIPRGLKTGLALRTGTKVVFLDRSDPVEDYFGLDVEAVIFGTRREVVNHLIPGRNGSDLVVTKVGKKSSKRNFLAVATHEETSVRGRLDFVKIYSDVLSGEIFHKVPAYKPSSLLSIEFDQGETLLVFMENQKTLQVYEYKGIEGFKHRSSAKIEGSKLILMTLPVHPYLNPRKAIAVVHENKISILTSVMAGNQIREDLKCGL